MTITSMEGSPMGSGAASHAARLVEADATLRRVPGSALRGAALTSPVGLIVLRRASTHPAGSSFGRDPFGVGRHEVLWLNPAATAILGGADAARDPAAQAVLAAAMADEGRAIEGRFVRDDGSTVVARLRSAAVRDAEGPCWIVHVEELSDQLRADEHLAASEEQFRALAANAPVGILCSDVGLRIGYVNSRLAAMLERSPDELLGTGWLDAVHPDDLGAALEAGAAVLAGKEVDRELRIERTSDGTRRMRLRATPLLRAGRGAGFVGSFEDVTEDRNHEEALSYQATHDPLTGLANRARIYDRLTTLLANERRAPLALLFFDLDDFKLVNDSLGHGAGDALLVEVAARLTGSLRPGDMVARVGGDEFVVLCEAVGREADAFLVADRLLGALSQPVVIGEHELRITASAGVVFAPPGDVTVDDLVRDADVAMYQAKEGGKARFAVFDEQVREGIQDRLTLSTDLRRALADDGLHVAYQPIVDIDSGQILSVEALVRWTHPTRGPIPPDRLVALAEEIGAVDDLGAFVLQTACRQLAEWRRTCLAPPGSVAVNLSATQLKHPGLVALVTDTLNETGLPGENLSLELTESVLMKDITECVDVLHRLRALGIRFAIDDFGTGYSSLSYLTRLPVDRLKIDRSFVAGLLNQSQDATIVSAVLRLAEALGLVAVAEGVETEEQRSALVRLGCRLAQGYLFSRPVSPAELAARFLPDPLLPAPIDTKEPR